jgi:hypothetical protein
VDRKTVSQRKTVRPEYMQELKMESEREEVETASQTGNT